MEKVVQESTQKRLSYFVWNDHEGLLQVPRMKEEGKMLLNPLDEKLPADKIQYI